MIRRFVIAAFVCGLSLAALVGAAPAQDFPSRPIKFIVSVSAGSPTDVIARLIAERASKELGQPIVVENLAGANGIIGTQAAMRAAPDGYTVLFGNASSHGLNPATVKALPYDAVNDFAPISKVGSATYVLATHPSIPANNAKEVIEYVKANPGKLTIGYGATASLMASEVFRAHNDLTITAVPYKGGAQTLSDLVAGQITMSFTDLVNTIPHRNAGKLKFHAVTGTKRSPLVPDVPTMGEAVGKDINVTAWIAAFAPSKTPRPVIDKLNAAIVASLKDPLIVKRMFDLSLEATPSTPEELGAFVVDEIKRNKEIVAAAGIEPK
jgi:tripartite-type tricarboxylate transporter receptor subunit TctC